MGPPLGTKGAAGASEGAGSLPGVKRRPVSFFGSWELWVGARGGSEGMVRLSRAGGAGWVLVVALGVAVWWW